jgi:hypothetical protein
MVGHDQSSAVATRTPHPEPPARAGESKDSAASEEVNAHLYILRCAVSRGPILRLAPAARLRMRMVGHDQS